MKNTKGQTTTEMVFVLPVLVMLAGGMLFIVYACWQDLKVQQAANLAARVEGQEKVGGGVSVDKINQENGFGPGIASVDADPTVNRQDLGIGASTQSSGQPLGGSLYERMRTLVRGLFSPGEISSISVPAPITGQNVDQINVYRTLRMPKIPFFKGNAGAPSQIILKGTAYGGEDPYMYALPRWGTTSDSGGSPEWRLLLKSARENTTD